MCGTFPSYFEKGHKLGLLADTAHYRTIANLFGVGKSSVCGIVKQVCEVIVRILLPRFIYIRLNRQEVQDNINGFESRAGFPQVVGAVDGCHVPIIGPQQSPDNYINRKGFYSLIVEGPVEFDYPFLDICVGWPCKVHDARVFKNSPPFALWEVIYEMFHILNCGFEICSRLRSNFPSTQLVVDDIWCTSFSSDIR